MVWPIEVIKYMNSVHGQGSGKGVLEINMSKVIDELESRLSQAHEEICALKKELEENPEPEPCGFKVDDWVQSETFTPSFLQVKEVGEETLVLDMGPYTGVEEATIVRQFSDCNRVSIRPFKSPKEFWVMAENWVQSKRGGHDALRIVGIHPFNVALNGSRFSYEQLLEHFRWYIPDSPLNGSPIGVVTG